MPKVSVVTGFYNRCEHLERTIESILNQTYSDFELIVFDDASTDGTASRLLELKEKYDDPRFRFIIHEENKGFVKGLSEAISGAKGQYIAVQGSGDVSLPRRLELQAEFLDANPSVGAVGGAIYNIQEDTGTRNPQRFEKPIATFDDLLTSNPFTHGEVMYRLDLYKSIGGYRSGFTFAQDRDLWLRMAKKADLGIIPDFLYHRYTLLDGVSFVPDKTIRQRCFSEAAVRLALMPEEEGALAYSRLEAEGPTAVVPIADRAVQKFVPKAAIRLCLYGAPETGLHMARDYIQNPLRRTIVVVLISIYSSRLIKPLQDILYKSIFKGVSISKPIKSSLVKFTRRIQGK